MYERSEKMLIDWSFHQQLLKINIFTINHVQEAINLNQCALFD